ncbi:hypothetical protein [Streptomyces sp. MMG1533]|nr:hypothetical protein [Streptomyces sp. MMG1533]
MSLRPRRRLEKPITLVGRRIEAQTPRERLLAARQCTTQPLP